jgi:hypothetical protein
MKVQLEATTKAKQLGEVNMFLALRYPIKVFQVVVNSLQVFWLNYLIHILVQYIDFLKTQFRCNLTCQLGCSNCEFVIA